MQRVVTLGGDQYVLNAASLVSAAANINDPQYATPVSPAYNGVGSIQINKPSGTFICTGSLLADGRTVLTAAHCLTNATSVSVNFYPSGPSAVSLAASGFDVHGSYTGQVIDQNDIAVIHLAAEAPAGITRYALATTSGENNPFRFVGFGNNGSNGAGTLSGAGFSLANRFSGENFFDITLGDPAWAGFWSSQTTAAYTNTLLADFDNGSTGYNSNNGMCWIGQYFSGINTSKCDPGRGIYEADPAPGDSGGPEFVDGKIAAVTSFGLTFAHFGPGPFPDINTTLDSSFGEFAGFTSVAYQNTWITEHMDLTSLDATADGPQVAPEPASVVFMSTGLLGMLVLVRRRHA